VRKKVVSNGHNAQLFVVCCFAGDARGVLGAVVRVAFVLGKLLAESFLGIGCALEKIERHFEFPRAGGTNGDGWNGSEPLGDPEIALFHEFSFTQGRMAWLLRLRRKSFCVGDFAPAAEADIH